MKEIGGYIDIDVLIKKPYYDEGIELNSGRNALLYIIEAQKISKIYLPYFICDSIINVLNVNSVSYEFYKINSKFEPIFNSEIALNEKILIVNFYGLISNNTLLQYKEMYTRIIVDNTHAFFQAPLSGVDTFYSCRKFLGVPDGAYLFTNILLSRKLDIDRSGNRFNHLLNRGETSAKEYFADYLENEKSLYDLGLMFMSRITSNILGAIDYDLIIKNRKRNYNFLAKELNKYNRLNLDLFVGIPYVYPLLVENGEQIRKNLIENKIYVPLLWPNLIALGDDMIEKKLAINILPLPCDQRYDESDMKLIVKEILKNV